MLHAPYDFNRNWGARCRTELSIGGLPAVVMENRVLRITVLSGAGSDVVELLHKPTDTDFMWRAPREQSTTVGPNGPSSEGDFFDQYLGGWHEMLPSFGPGHLHGARVGQCGEVTLLPWAVGIERDDSDCVRIRFEVRVRQLPLKLVKRLSIDAESPTLFIEETVQNEGGQPIDFTWGHHATIGPAFLNPDCRIETGGGRVVGTGPGGPDAAIEPGAEGVWPHLPGLDGSRLDVSCVRPYTPGWEEDVCLRDVGDPWVAVSDPGRGLGFGLAWEREVFPNLWIWQNFGGRFDHPWHGRTYCLGLEPLSSFPFEIEEALAQNTQLRLAPTEAVSTRLCATVFNPKGDLSSIDVDGDVRFDSHRTAPSPSTLEYDGEQI